MKQERYIMKINEYDRIRYIKKLDCMSEDQGVKLDNNIVLLAITENGGYTYAQMESLGVSVPGRKGWLKNIIGIEFTKDQIKDFIVNRDIYRRKNKQKNIGLTSLEENQQLLSEKKTEVRGLKKRIKHLKHEMKEKGYFKY